MEDKLKKEIEEISCKFAEWMSSAIASNYKSGGTWVINFKGINNTKFKTTKQLFQYFIKNIYQNENTERKG